MSTRKEFTVNCANLKKASDIDKWRGLGDNCFFIFQNRFKLPHELENYFQEVFSVYDKPWSSEYAKDDRIQEQLEIPPNTPICPNQPCRSEARPPHTCPYKEDVNSNATELCMCCNNCQYECERDI